MELEHVDGQDRGHIILYALSTCVWCKKTKGLLNDSGVDYYYIDVDLASEEDKEDVKKEVLRFNKKVSFPTIVIDDKKSIQGFKEDEIRETLSL